LKLINRQVKICTSIGVKDTYLLKEKVEEALVSHSDLIEIRVDYFDKIDFFYIKKVIKGYEKRIILTCRARSEGGKFKESEIERQKILIKLAKFKPAYIDIELSLAQSKPELIDIIRKLGVLLIISWHDFRDTPPFQILKNTFNKAKFLGDLVKIVPMANNFMDNLSILKLYEISELDRLIAFCMGEKGQISRILCPLFGSPFTYASLSNLPTAPAQITIKELREFYGLF